MEDSAPRKPGHDDGLVWIENGMVRVRNPLGRGRWPSIMVPEDGYLSLSVNGSMVTGIAVLRAEDELVIHAPTRELPGEIQVTVAEDEMSAWIRVLPAFRVSVQVSQVPPARQVSLVGVETREPLPPGFSKADVHEALRKAGVLVGLLDQAVSQALAAPGEMVLAAKARRPRAGKPAVVWTVVHGELASQGSAVAETANGPRRPFVQVGDVVAQITPGVTSEPGETVTGQTIHPDPIWCPALVGGEGVLLSADQLTAIATVEGHPTIVAEAERVFATIRPEIQVDGDVDDSTGEIDFKGDIWIAGDVLAGRSVRAVGTVAVNGKVVQAQIEAARGIDINGGAANSLLLAGGAGFVYAQALPTCEGLLAEVISFAEGSDGARWPVRTERLVRSASQLVRFLRDAQTRLDDEVEILIARLQQFTHAFRRGAPVDFCILPPALEAATSCMHHALSAPADCRVKYLDNARAEATGDIWLGAPGACRSTVVCLGELHVAGTFRGGSAFAARGADLATVGTPHEAVVTRIEIGPRAGFRASEVYPGTIIVRGKAVRRFETLTKNVFLDGDFDDPVPAGGRATPQGSGMSPLESGRLFGSARAASGTAAER